MAVGYYDQEFEPWARGIRSIGSAIVQAPMLRAQAADRAQRAQLTQAQIGTEGAQKQHYLAQSGKTDAETAILVKKGQLVTALEQSAAQAQQDIAAGNTDTPAVRTFSGAASALTGVNGDDIVKSARQGIGTILGRMGKVTEAAAVENPVELEKARITGNRGQVVQPGGALVKDGQLVYQNPSAASQREGEYETTTEDFPATDEVTETIPGKKNYGLFGIDRFAKDEPDTTRVVKPAQPARKVTTRRKLGDAMATAPAANQTQDPDDSSEPVEEPAGAEDDGQNQPAGARPSVNFPKPATFGGKQLDPTTAKAILAEVGGDKNKARELARQRGYTF